MVYAAEPDPLCYPRTSVLKNLQHLEDQAELDEFEFAMYLSRAEEPLPGGDLGYEHYLSIHKHLFQDVYLWAGQARTIRIGKGDNWFCYPQYLAVEMAKAFEHRRMALLLKSSDHRQFAQLAASLLSDINAAHPFREGNGRTQLAYLALLAATAGYDFDPTKLEPDRVMSAMIASFSGDLTALTNLIEDIVR